MEDGSGRDELQQVHLEFLAAVLANDMDRQWEKLLEIEDRVFSAPEERKGGAFSS